MKVVVIHGQNHEGSTCVTAREFARKVGGGTREFFLHRGNSGPHRGEYPQENR